MAGVYIPGMEMPKRGHTVTLTILGGGEVCVQYYDCKPHLTVPIVYKAVPVPDHGRLIDGDATVETLKRLRKYHLDDSRSGGFIALGISQCIDVLTGKDAPAIIPADKEGVNG